MNKEIILNIFKNPKLVYTATLATLKVKSVEYNILVDHSKLHDICSLKLKAIRTRSLLYFP